MVLDFGLTWEAVILTQSPHSPHVLGLERAVLGTCWSDHGFVWVYVIYVCQYVDFCCSCPCTAVCALKILRHLLVTRFTCRLHLNLHLAVLCNTMHTFKQSRLETKSKNTSQFWTLTPKLTASPETTTPLSS